MHKVKRRIWSGNICEQYTYAVPDGVRKLDKCERKPRFENEEDRKRYNWKLIANRHRRKFMATFDTESLYGTLTFDDAHECLYFKDAKRIARNLMKSLRRKYPDSVIWMYTGRGRHTARIHFHFVSKGIPREAIIKKWCEKWQMGRVIRIDKLRKHNKYNGVDHGTDWTGLADYLLSHWTEEVGGHAWMQSGKSQEPAKEPVTECIRNYNEQHPPRAPKGYTLVETKTSKYGYCWFKYVKLPPAKAKPNRLNIGGSVLLS